MISAGFQAVQVENLGQGQGILSFFKETGPTAKVVLGILLIFSLISWIIIFAKFVRLRRVSRQSEKFVEFFRKSRRFSEVNTVANQLTDTPLSTLFKAGYAELDAQVKANRPDDPGATASGVTLSQRFLIRNISGIERALERAIGVEVSRLVGRHANPCPTESGAAHGLRARTAGGGRPPRVPVGVGEKSAAAAHGGVGRL